MRVQKFFFLDEEWTMETLYRLSVSDTDICDELPSL
jgi:hypothetical protein